MKSDDIIALFFLMFFLTSCGENHRIAEETNVDGNKKESSYSIRSTENDVKYLLKYEETGDKIWLDSHAVHLKRILSSVDSYSSDMIQLNLETAKIDEVLGRNDRAMKQYAAVERKLLEIRENPAKFRNRYFEQVPVEIRNKTQMDESFQESIDFFLANCNVLLNHGKSEDYVILNRYRGILQDSIVVREDLFTNYELE